MLRLCIDKNGRHRLQAKSNGGARFLNCCAPKIPSRPAEDAASEPECLDSFDGAERLGLKAVVCETLDQIVGVKMDVPVKARNSTTASAVPSFEMCCGMAAS